MIHTFIYRGKYKIKRERKEIEGEEDKYREKDWQREQGESVRWIEREIDRGERYKRIESDI